MSGWENEAPCLREKIGTAVHAGNLASDVATGLERPVDRIAALGKVTQAWHWSPRLAELLWRWKYGGDKNAAAPAVKLFAHELQRRANRRGWSLENGSILVNFTVRVLAEWRDDKCAVCGGRKMIGGDFDPGSDKLRPCTSCEGKGAIYTYTPAMLDLLLHGDHDGQEVNGVRHPCEACCSKGTVVGRKFKRKAEKLCGACQGSGYARFSAASRAQALGVDVSIYRKHWERRFGSAISTLHWIDSSISRPLQKELGRNTLRA